MSRSRRPRIALLLVVLALGTPGCLSLLGAVDKHTSDLEAAQDETDGLRKALDAASAGWAHANVSVDEAVAELRAARDVRDEARAEASDLRRTLDARETDLAHANATIASLQARSASGSGDAALQEQLRAEEARYAALQARYDDMVSARYPAITTIDAGNVTWHFTDLQGNARQWTYSLDSYRAYVGSDHPTDAVQLTTGSGRRIVVPDPRPYVTPSFFSKVVSDLTDGRDDHAFVREAFNLKHQMVVYNDSLVDKDGLYKFPAETLTEGTGICGDTTILLASLLLAGNATAKYGFDVIVWIGDLDTGTGQLVHDAETVNHAFLEIQFRDGDKWFVETTSPDFSTYPEVWGWSFGLTPDEVSA